MAKSTSATPPAASQGARSPRPSKATRWRAAVLIGVHVLAAIHIAHWMSTGSTMTPLEPSEAMEFSKHSVVNAGLVFFALTILSTLVLGRWFCGWACHVVALQDLSRALLLKVGVRPRPLRSRWMMWMPTLAAIYMFAYPLAYRLWIGDELAVREVELTRQGFWDTFPTWGPALLTFFVAGFVAVYFLGAKGFCTYACPYGAVFGAVDRFSPGRIRVNDDCVQCGHCTLTCTSNVDVSREVHDYGMVVDAGCMKCMDCVSVCPENALSFGLGRPALLAKPRQEKRKAAAKMPFVEEVVGTLSFAFGYFAIRGFYQERGFLLSVGLAACFAFLAVTALRLVRRDDVRLPGVALKVGGRVRAAGVGLGLGTLALSACAVPYGLMPEFHAVRARDAWSELADARTRWLEQRFEGLSDAERAAAESVLEHSRAIRGRTYEPSLANTERLALGSGLLGDAEAYDRHLDELVRFGSARVDHWTLYARRLAGRGDAAGAIEAYRRILDRYPGDVGVVVQLCGLLASQGDLPQSLAVVEAALEVSPGAGQLLAQRGLLRASLNDLPGATLDFEAAVAASPDLLLAREMLWQSYLEAGRTQDALAVLRAAVDHSPDFVGARDRLFRVLVQEQQPGEALRVLREGLARDGAPREYRAHVAQILLVTGRPAEALEEARTLLDEAEGSVPLMEVAREVMRQAGAPEEAAAAQAKIDAAAASD